MFNLQSHHNCVKRKYPWYRETIEDETFADGDNETLPYISASNRHDTHKENVSLDIDTKRAALKASSSVVALLSYTGEQELTQCSGVIIEKDATNAHIVLTSAKLIRRPTEENVLEDHLASSLKVIIYLSGGGLGELYEGHVCAYDFHYNIAWIQFQSDLSLPTANLRQVDDCIYVNSAEEKSLQLRPHSDRFNLVPGHPVVAMGRYFERPFDLMAAPGEFVIDRRCDEFGCKELLMVTCMMTQCAEGGPLINLSGEFIGISFYGIGYTPFLPINIAQKSWEHYKRYGTPRRPFLGIEATNLWAADISHIEMVIHKIPSICNGVLVEKVIEGSSLHSAGLHENDVIVQCDGKTVHSLMEFLEMVWDKKIGDKLQLRVVRISENELVLLHTVVDEVALQNFYRWPRN